MQRAQSGTQERGGWKRVFAKTFALEKLTPRTGINSANISCSSMLVFLWGTT